MTEPYLRTDHSVLMSRRAEKTEIPVAEAEEGAVTGAAWTEVVEEEGAEGVTMTEDMTMEVIIYLTISFNGRVRYLSQVSVSY